MSKFWRVVVYEYTRHVLRRRFLFGLLSLPLVLAVIGAVIFLLMRSETSNLPVGYVDDSGLLAHAAASALPVESGKAIEFRPFDDQAQAEQALLGEQIQAYFILPKDYRYSGAARLVARKQPGPAVTEQFSALVSSRLLAGRSPEIIKRFSEGSNLLVRSVDGDRQMGENEWFNILVPFFTGFFFMTAMFTVSGYLMQAVVEEKENRTMEVLITSISSLQLMAGKVVGIIGVGLTQLFAWAVFLLLGAWLGRNSVTWLTALRFSPQLVVLMGAVLLPSFVMLSGLIAAAGSTVSEVREGQQITGMFTLPVVLPYWFTYQIMTNPNGPLAVGLSFFPLTAPVTLIMRAGFTEIPRWQIGITLALLTLSALAALWLAGRAFRLGMLRYGSRLTLRELFGRRG